MRRFEMYIEDGDHSAISQIAQIEGVSIAEIIRRGIKLYLKKNH